MEHLKQCDTCSRFYDSLSDIRQELMVMSPQPEISPGLFRQTQLACRNRLQDKQELSYLQHLFPGIPVPVLFLIAGTLILTIIWTVPGLVEIDPGNPLTDRSILSLGITLQNLIMLILSPLILNKFRITQKTQNS